MSRATSWSCGGKCIDLSRCRVMGVLNVTPDSFSDGGSHCGPDAAVEWGRELLDGGADIIDVGGESTRPGFCEVDPAEEIARIAPVVEELAAKGAVVSIDTRHPDVARAALEAGAAIVNDVSGFEDPEMLEVVANSDCGCVAMRSSRAHVPLAGARDKLAESSPGASPAEITQYLVRRAEALQDAGVSADRICLDPGTGFGGGVGADLEVLRGMGSLCDSGYACMCAVSRKRVVGAIAGLASALDRDAATVGMSLAAVAAGAHVVRVHDVASMRRALDGFEACSGRAPLKRALVALGSNMGDRVATMVEALSRIAALPATRIVSVSDVYETEPAYYVDQPRFANAVALVETGLHPFALLGDLLGIEDSLGRVRTVANGSRTLDLDLLWMQGESYSADRLMLPHPRMGERDFVMVPLADVLGGRDEAERFCKQEGIPLVEECRRFGAVAERLGRLVRNEGCER